MMPAVVQHLTDWGQLVVKLFKQLHSMTNLPEKLRQQLLLSYVEFWQTIDSKQTHLKVRLALLLQGLLCGVAVVMNNLASMVFSHRHMQMGYHGIGIWKTLLVNVSVRHVCFVVSMPDMPCGYDCCCPGQPVEPASANYVAGVYGICIIVVLCWAAVVAGACKGADRHPCPVFFSSFQTATVLGACPHSPFRLLCWRPFSV